MCHTTVHKQLKPENFISFFPRSCRMIYRNGILPMKSDGFLMQAYKTNDRVEYGDESEAGIGLMNSLLAILLCVIH